MMAEPTPAMLTELWWMRLVNWRRIGLYGASLRRHGPVSAAEECVRAGLARRRDDGSADHRGYWITANGRAALQEFRKERR